MGLRGSPGSKSAMTDTMVPVDKLGKDLMKKIVNAASAKPGDILLFAADSFDVACSSLGAVRTELGRRLGLTDPNVFAYCWVNDFPMFEKSKDTGEIGRAHV